MTTRNTPLFVSGCLLALLALFQAVISLSQEWSRYFGAGEVADNFPLLVIAGEACALLFALFALYAFSGAGCLRRLPFLRSVLVFIAAVFLLRGLAFVPQLLVNGGAIETPFRVPARMVAASFVSLGIGLICAVGIVRGWKSMKPPVG